MAEYTLYYATNRKHIGSDRWHPDGYGTKFSDDGMENLRFGVVRVTAAQNKIKACLNADVASCGTGDGVELAQYLSECAQSAKIDAYEEEIGSHIAEAAQKRVKLGSQALFADVQAAMENSSDVLIYIHGFSVSWHEAVGAALAMQLMLQNTPGRAADQDIRVILFTWPSDGMALPWVSYKSDRSEATGSGAAVGRALLKTRDYLAALRDRAQKGGKKLCGQQIVVSDCSDAPNAPNAEFGHDCPCWEATLC